MADLFVEYEATNGHSYALHPSQIRGFDGDQSGTKILATIGGVALTFRVAKPYKEVMHEWRAAVTRATEETA